MSRKHHLAAQAWVRGSGAAVPSADLIEPVAPDASSGGLWTSTWDARSGSAWIRWCIARDVGARPFDVWVLYPHRHARVVVVDDHRDVDRLMDEHGGIALDKLAARFDGVRFTADGAAKTRIGGFDVESTLWFRWSFVRVRRVGDFRLAGDRPSRRR